MCDPWFSWRVLIRTNCLNNHWICVPRFKSSKTTSLESQRAMAPWLKSVWGKMWWMREIFARWLESKVFQTTISVWFLVPQISLGFIKFAETSDAEKVLRTEIQIDRHVRPANSVDFKHAKMQWLQFGENFASTYPSQLDPIRTEFHGIWRTMDGAEICGRKCGFLKSHPATIDHQGSPSGIIIAMFRFRPR